MGAPSSFLNYTDPASAEFVIEPGESQSFGLKLEDAEKVKTEVILMTLQLKDDEGKWHEMPGKRYRKNDRLISVFEAGTWRFKRPENLPTGVGIFKTH